MSWLTGKEVKILHRELKPGNVLLDSNWTCKVCDFGLSFLESKGMVKGDAVGGGSPYWMSPEALLDQLPITEKNDVYAFSLVLWEIMTQEHFFQEYNDLDLFTEDIGRKGIRPPVEKIQYPQITAIIQKCWDADQNVRPSFADLISILKKVRLDINLPASLCPEAAGIWGEAHAGVSSLPLAEFVKILKKATLASQSAEFYISMLDILLFSKHGKSTEGKDVTLDIFADLLKWFGPVNKSSHTDSLLDKIASICEKKWFFGLISREEAEEKLKNHKDEYGTFLVRLNTGTTSTIESAPYAISRVVNSGEYMHTRVTPAKSGGFYVSISDDTNAKHQVKGDTIKDIIANIDMKQIKEVSKDCSGHPWSKASRVVIPNNYEIGDGESDTD